MNPLLQYLDAMPEAARYRPPHYPNPTQPDPALVSEPPTRFPPRSSGGGLGGGFWDRLAIGLHASPITANLGGDFGAFLSGLINSGTRSFSANRLHDMAIESQDAKNLAELNREETRLRHTERRQNATDARTHAREVRSDYRAERSDRRAQAAADRQAAEDAMTDEEYGARTAARTLAGRRWLRARGETTSGQPKPGKAYTEDKIAQAIKMGLTASEFEAKVNAAREKLKAAGFNPDSLIEKGWRQLPHD